MQTHSRRYWDVPSQGSDEGRDEAITEPSGAGAFAEAMRELIAQLTPVPQALLRRSAAPETGARRPALYLVR